MLQKNGNNFDASCLRMSCTATKVQIKLGDNVFECPSKGVFDVNFPVYQGKIDCPSYGEICTDSLEHRCNMDCYGKGFCMSDRTCQCFKGFFGKDCHDGRENKDEKDPFITNYRYDANDTGSDDDNGDEEETPEGPLNPENPVAQFYMQEIIKLDGESDEIYVAKYADDFKIKKLEIYKDHFQSKKRNQE